MAWSSPRTWVTNEVVTAAHMNQEIRDNLDAALPDAVSAVAWTPTLEATTTDPSTSAVAGREWVVGALQFVWVRFVISASGGVGGSGTYFVTLPSTALGVTAHTGSGQVVGSWHARDVSTTTSFPGTVYLRSSTTVGFAVGTGTASSVITDAAPFAWDSDDVLSFQAVYPIA